MVSGIVLTGLGVVGIAIGVGLIVDGQNSHSDCSGCESLAGVAQGSVGLILVGIGLPLWLVGASAPSPDDEGALSRLSGKRSLAPSVRVGPRNATLAWAF